MTDSDWWPADYFASRSQFIELAQASDACIGSHPTDAVGPGSEPLSVDTAVLTSGRTEHLIVLTSGVHGVEGFLGACLQMRALEMLAHVGIPDRTGIVMIHAVNPWGFAHLRRVDENNVDVNRNFIAESLPASHPRYAELDPLINPRHAPTASDELGYWLNAGSMIVRDRGIATLSKAIAEGQYDYPQGMFFGGTAAGRSCELLQKLVSGFAADAERITVLDVHSGLGPSGIATLIGSSTFEESELLKSRLQAHYGQPTFVDNASSNPYNAQATFSRWCQRTLSKKRCLYLCVEIGTVNPIRLFSALRRENQAHHWTEKHSKPYVRSKQALREVFAPGSRQWRHKSVTQGLQVLRKTLDLPAGPEGSDS